MKWLRVLPPKEGYPFDADRKGGGGGGARKKGSRSRLDQKNNMWGALGKCIEEERNNVLPPKTMRGEMPGKKGGNKPTTHGELLVLFRHFCDVDAASSVVKRDRIRHHFCGGGGREGGRGEEEEEEEEEEAWAHFQPPPPKGNARVSLPSLNLNMWCRSRRRSAICRGCHRGLRVWGKKVGLR